MKQLTLATVGFERYARTTQRATFLDEMDRVVPSSALCALIEPFYPKPGNGRPPVGVERMLRIYFLQQWFNLSDPAVEEALYDSRAMRGFVGIDLGREPVPDETTVCRFRHLLEQHGLGRQLFDEVQQHLAAKGLKVATGTIVDATIIKLLVQIFLSHQFTVSSRLSQQGLSCRQLQDQRRVIGEPGDPLLMGIVDGAGASGQLL
jgi:transposase, IS5 family